MIRDTREATLKGALVLATLATLVAAGRVLDEVAVAISLWPGSLEVSEDVKAVNSSRSTVFSLQAVVARATMLQELNVYTNLSCRTAILYQAKQSSRARSMSCIEAEPLADSSISIPANCACRLLRSTFKPSVLLCLRLF